MSEKNEIKIKLSTAIFMFIILVLIAALGIVYYLGFIRNNNENAEGVNEVKNTEARIEEKDDIEKDNTENKEITDEKEMLKLGLYDINGDPVDPSDGSGISSITLSKNNKFTIELVYSEEYTGTYEIKDNKLICNSNKHKLHAGGTSTEDTDVIFEFEIINNNKIEFSDVKNSEDDFELNEGISYIIK